MTHRFEQGCSPEERARTSLPALREVELREFLDGAAEGIHTVAADGTITWANRAELRLLGYSAEEYVGSQIRNVHADPALVEEILARLSRDEVLENVEARLRAKDGSIRHVLISSNVAWRDGEFLYTRCFTRDITDRKRGENELRELAARLHAVIEQEKEQRRITETLLRVSTLLSAELDLDALLQKITDEATGLCRAEFGSFFYNVINDAGESYTLYTLSGVPREAFDGFEMPRNTALFAATFSGAGVVRLDDVEKDPRSGGSAPLYGMPKARLPVASYLAVPVKTRAGQVLGGLFFGHSKPGVFTEADERLLVAVSANAASAIENARSYQSARLAEKKAQLEGQRLHDLFMQTPAAIYILRGPELVFEFANPVTFELFSGRSLLGRPLLEAVPDADQKLVEALRRILSGGEREEHKQRSIRLDWRGKGRPEERFFDLLYEPWRDENGAIVGVICFAFEITELVAARRKVESVAQELETASRMKDDFLATLSHELRTPLNAILGWTRMLRSGMVGEERRARALETIERNAGMQTQLIEDLLDVSRITSGKMRLEIASVDMAQVVGNAIDAVRPAALAKEIEIRQTLDPGTGPIIGDAQRLQQVVWNLLSNGVKFTAKGGQVDVILRRRDSALEIIVADNGQGIPAEFLPHVFERFRQADSALARKHMGLGLGLAIVRHLVEMHGGYVSVESEGPGKGTSFIVSLPIAPVRSVTATQVPVVRQSLDERAPSYPPELAGLRVLIVEDDEDARELLAQLLEPYHGRTVAVGSVSEALSALQEWLPDVIISDIGLPGEDGYAFIQKLRALPPHQGGRIPAVALTAYARVEDRTKALMAGFNMHVPKPVEPAELMAVLASLSSLFPRE
jgi:PAS domain S-box-containing protein